MLTHETQKRIACLFECIAENERQVEVVRQVLSEQDDFDPHSLFSKLSANKNYILRKDITDFLDNYSVRYLPYEMNLLFYNYNASKEKMNYTNFLKMILPNSSHFLRQLKVELIPHRRKQIELTYELEWALIRVFEKELQLYRVVEVQKEEIVSRWDFKVSATFRCISQKSSKQYIEHGDLQNFIDLMNCSSTSDDILNILRRCDHDKDGKFSQFDLELSLTPFKKYKPSLIQQAQQYQQQEKKQQHFNNYNLTNSAVYNNNSNNNQSSKKKGNHPQQVNSAQKERPIQNNTSSHFNTIDQPKTTKSRSFSYQNVQSSIPSYPQNQNYQQDNLQSSTNRSNRKSDDQLDQNRTPRRQTSNSKIKQSGSYQKNSDRKGQGYQTSEQNLSNNNNSNYNYSNNVTPTKTKGNVVVQNTTGNNHGRCNSSNGANTSSKANQHNIINKNSTYNNNQLNEQVKGNAPVNSNKKWNGFTSSDNKMNSSSGMKSSYQHNHHNPPMSNSSKVTSKINKPITNNNSSLAPTTTSSNINNSFLNYKEELKNQIRNEIMGQQHLNQKRNISNNNNVSSSQVYQNENINNGYQEYQKSQPSVQSSQTFQNSNQKVLLLSNYHQNNNSSLNPHNPRYENSSNKRYGDLKQKLVDELNSSLILSEKNSPTNQIYKQLKDNLYSNHKNNNSSINYDSSIERKNQSQQYGREFKQKLREELQRSAEKNNHKNILDNNYDRNSPSPVRNIKVDVKDINPMKQQSNIITDKLSSSYQNNNSYVNNRQPQTEKKHGIPNHSEQTIYGRNSLNNTLKDKNNNNISNINNINDEDISRYYPSTEKKFMKTQALTRDQLDIDQDEIHQNNQLKKTSNDRAIPSPVRTSYQDNMKEYFLDKKRRQQVEEEVEQQMIYKQQQQKQKQLQPQSNNSRQQQPSYSPYSSSDLKNRDYDNNQDILLRKQSIKDQQIIDQLEKTNEIRYNELKRIKEIEEQQIRELELIKQKQFLLEEERNSRIKKEESLRKQQIEEEIFRREIMKKEQEEIQRLEHYKREREKLLEQEQKIQVSAKERIRIDEEIRMKQLKSQKLERDVQNLESKLARQSSVEQQRQFNQLEDIRRENEIILKQRDLEKTKREYEYQQKSLNNTHRSQDNSILNQQQYQPINQINNNSIKLHPVPISNEQQKIPSYNNNIQENFSSPIQSLRHQQQNIIKNERELSLEYEAKQKITKEIEEKKLQLELDNQKQKEMKLNLEKQKRLQQNLDETLIMEKKRQELLQIEEQQKRKLQEIEIEKYKNQKLLEIEQQENERIMALEKDLSYTNLQKINHFNNSFKPEESPSRAYEVISKSSRIDYNKTTTTPNKSNNILNKSMNGLNLSQLETLVLQIFKQIIDSSNEIQNIKENLSMRADFTLSDAFRIMDVNSKGIIELSAFEQFLKNIDIHSSRESIHLLFSKICPRNQKFLKKEDVDELFKPLSSDHSTILANRMSLYNPKFADFGKLTFETKDILSNYFKTLLQFEQKLEQMKEELLHSREFKLDDAYFLLDKQKNGHLTHDDLKKVLDSYHIFAMDKDIKNILLRFDRYQRGKITFEDFRSEILPNANYN